MPARAKGSIRGRAPQPELARCEADIVRTIDVIHRGNGDSCKCLTLCGIDHQYPLRAVAESDTNRTPDAW